MEQIDENQVAFNVPQQGHYAFDALPEEGSMNLDFSPLPEFEPLSGPSISANVSAPAIAGPSALNHGSRLALRGSAIRKPGTNTNQAVGTLRYPAQPHNRARAVTQQFGQAAARLRIFEERLSKIEQQNHALLCRVAAYEKRMHQIQLGLQKAEEGHEEIAEMVKASVSFLNELNGDSTVSQPSEQQQF